MTQPAQEFLVCPACGKRGRFRPEFLGHRIKCPCGQMMDVAAPSADDGLYELTGEEPALMAPGNPTGVAPSVDSQATHSPPAMPASFARVSRPAIEEDDRLKKILLIGVPALLLVVIAAVIGLKRLGGGPPKLPVKGEDARVLQMIDDEHGMDVDAWLAENPSRVVEGMVPSQAHYRVEALKKLGAVRVMAFGTIMSRYLAIDLPDDPAQRTALFNWQAQWHGQTVPPEKIWKDEGQHWLLIRLRL